MRSFLCSIIGKTNQRGAVLVLVAILMIVFIGVAALALDVSHLYLVRNELQNAADAGALAGARELFLNDASINENANQIAHDIAILNYSGKIPVEVNEYLTNLGDVQRGHWSFANREFTAEDSLEPYSLSDKTEAELDADTTFVNAVRVKVRRQDTPVKSFFAGILGYADFAVTAEAVAYIGFAGTLAPEEADQPIAICQESILNEDGTLSCNIGRMINSGQDETSNETGGWTDFNQDDPCKGGTNAHAVESLICSSGNPESIIMPKPIATNGGQISSAFKSFRDCWEAATEGKTKSWNLTLAVVTCPGNNMGTCENTAGAVNVNVIWVTDEGEDPDYLNVPTKMDDWSDVGLTDLNSDGVIDGEDRWADFVDHFNLRNVNGSDAPYQKKAIYFKPDCTIHEPTGVSGGHNFGVLAEIPVLVN